MESWTRGTDHRPLHLLASCTTCWLLRRCPACTSERTASPHSLCCCLHNRPLERLEIRCTVASHGSSLGALHAPSLMFLLSPLRLPLLYRCLLPHP
ncbi:hypothetical protein GUJ93_ZPchr0003g17730 [Zizania palustris]|uniref:Uncharacterized protein n=1 Tax=Zizania palustris TaxID=103762 RepID=A0A8J5VLG9_ZIZPA|nr:hypothetical protein GUJ93_ZPchr0003g17730 [Zizania palustris]